ncbi:hypothetical protein BCU90_17350 [Vibrio lentus]|uniref:hypothetical protein n=1 Tax=Vibrio lentus TaxID=136468 RepID=UPI000C82EC18|nr:hypothetical protein [Vibrio lentus]PMG45630.1 hypothetical protein BCU90_17350 [Vibrio lentus]
MSEIKGTVTYFDLKEFGFYRLRKKKDPEYITGDIPQVIDSLFTWLDGKTVCNTIPWDAETNQRRTSMYCRSYAKNEATGDTVLVLWKDVGDSTGNVHGAYANSNVGSDTSDGLTSGSEVAGEGVIWGQPCYYWLIPSENKVASIKFTSSIADTESLCHYVKAFVDYRGQFPNKKVTERTIANARSSREVKIKSFTFEHKDEKGKTFRTNFKMRSKMYKKASASLDYERLADEVSHIVYRETISASVNDTRPLWSKMFDKLGSGLGFQAPPTKGSREIEVIVDANPSPHELRGLVTRYGEEHDETSDWNNIGLKLGGRSESTTWLDEYVVRDELLVPQVENEVYTADQLLRAITAQRTRLVSELAVAVPIPAPIEENNESGDESENEQSYAAEA